jgi:hypothetical protein
MIVLDEQLLGRNLEREIRQMSYCTYSHRAVQRLAG